MSPRLRQITAQTLGFVGGALVGYWAARLLGHDLLQDHWDDASVLAIAAVGLCGGIGIGAGRRWAEAPARPQSGE